MSTTHHHISEDLDLSFANGSFKDLAMRMGDLDKELEEIALVSNGGNKANTNTNTNKMDDDDDDYKNDYDDDDDDDKRPSNKVHHSHPLEMSAGDDGLEYVSDQEDDDGLDDLTKELRNLDAAACQAKQERVLKHTDNSSSRPSQQEQQPLILMADATLSSPPPIKSTTTTTTTVTATIFKPTPDASIGISMKTSKGITLIIKITPGGLMSNTCVFLQVGMRIVSINDKLIRNARHARELIQMSRMEVSITCLTTTNNNTAAASTITTDDDDKMGDTAVERGGGGVTTKKVE